MSKTLTPSAAKFVTSRDPKGRKFLDVAAAVYDKADLKDDEAQRVNEASGLADLIANHIAQHRHEVPPVLKPVAKGIPVAGAKRFVAKESFTRENGFYLWDTFRQYFLDKVEENVKDATVAVHRLEKMSLDDAIREELGHEREEIALTHFFDLLRKQSEGQDRHLLTNGYANIAYIRDKDGNLWAVGASWRAGYRDWLVLTYSVDGPSGWRVGYQVLSSDC